MKKTGSAAPTGETLDDLRLRLAPKVAENAAFDGWSRRALDVTAQQTGVNFDCAAWDQENGPGTLVLAAPSLNTLAVNQQPTDIITSFVFVD